RAPVLSLLPVFQEGCNDNSNSSRGPRTKRRNRPPGTGDSITSSARASYCCGADLLSLHEGLDLVQGEPTYAVQQIARYSITSSARARSVGGTSRPSAFAVVGCAFRKSYPDVMVVQSRQDRDGYNDPGPLHCPT